MSICDFLLLVAVVVKRKDKHLITERVSPFHDDFPLGLCGEVVGEQLWLHNCLNLCATDLALPSIIIMPLATLTLISPFGPFLPLRTWGVQGQPVVGREMM